MRNTLPVSSLNGVEPNAQPPIAKRTFNLKKILVVRKNMTLK